MRKVFIHIPRTGGSSLYKILTSNGVLWVGHDLRSINFKFYHQVAKKGDVAFAFVRDPYQRVISAYNYLRAGGNNPQDANDAYLLGIKTMTFGEFVMEGLERAAQWQIHFIPQWKWIVYDNAFLTLHVGNLRKYEDYNKEFIKVCDEFGIKSDILPPRTNQSNLDEKRKVIAIYESDTDVMKKIREVYRCDYELFGY